MLKIFIKLHGNEENWTESEGARTKFYNVGSPLLLRLHWVLKKNCIRPMTFIIIFHSVTLLNKNLKKTKVQKLLRCYFRSGEFVSVKKSIVHLRTLHVRFTACNNFVRNGYRFAFELFVCVIKEHTNCT